MGVQQPWIKRTAHMTHAGPQSLSSWELLLHGQADTDSTAGGEGMRRWWRASVGYVPQLGQGSGQ